MTLVLPTLRCGIRYRSRRAIALLVLIALVTAAPGLAARKKVQPMSTTSSTPAGEVFVYALDAKPAKEVSLVLDEVFSRNVMYLIFAKEIDETRGIYKADRSTVKIKPAEGTDSLAAVYLLIVGDEQAKQSDTKQWRQVVYSVLHDAAKAGVVLKFADGSEAPARWGPDDNLIYFMFDHSHFMRNTEGDLVMKQYIWEKKEDYLAMVPIFFSVNQAQWKATKPVSLRLGESELTFLEIPAKKRR